MDFKMGWKWEVKRERINSLILQKLCRVHRERLPSVWIQELRIQLPPLLRESHTQMPFPSFSLPLSFSQPSPALFFLSNSLTICEISYGEALPLDTLPREKRTRFKYPIRYLVTHSMKREVWPWHCHVDYNALRTPVILNVWYGHYHSQLKKTPFWSSGPTWNSTGLLSSDSLGPLAVDNRRRILLGNRDDDNDDASKTNLHFLV